LKFLPKSFSSFYFRYNNLCDELNIFLLKAIAMRLLSREYFKQGIVHCGLMFIGVVILQARPNGGFLQSKTSLAASRCYLSIHCIRICKQQVHISAIENFL